jgi:betaine-aldehyde dehydrogenase/5-carboxymethyl-2-hydroxymuconic-semialdehyde dehydrogenase
MNEIRIAGVRVSTDHFINGQRIHSPRTFEDISPIDESVLGPIAAGGPDEVDAAVSAAKQASPAWAALGPAGRGNLLRRLADIIESHAEHLAIVETTDNGALLEAHRLRVMKRAALNVSFFANFAEKLHIEEWDAQPANARNRVRYDPAGVTAIITPWNAPLMLATWRIGPALAAGNTVVLKPPEWAPLTASLLADYAHEAGLPPGVFNVVQGLGPEAGAALVSHPDVKRIAFTGSPETARKIGTAAAQNLTPVSFELGGKSPFIVFKDADLDLAVKTALGQYDNAGQVCLAGTRLLIERPIANEFLERMVEGVRASVVLGDPRQPETTYGPLITRQHLQRVQGFVERARQAGSTLVYGGNVSEKLGGLYYEPTLFMDVPLDAEILKREVFGPVLTLQTFDDEAQAIDMANDNPYGLAAVIFTRNEARARRVSESVVAGTVWVNCFFVRDLGAPFGGARLSGIGREGGQWSFDFYCDVKNICHRIGTFA